MNVLFSLRSWQPMFSKWSFVDFQKSNIFKLMFVLQCLSYPKSWIDPIFWSYPPGVCFLWGFGKNLLRGGKPLFWKRSQSSDASGWTKWRAPKEPILLLMHHLKSMGIWGLWQWNTPPIFNRKHIFIHGRFSSPPLLYVPVKHQEKTQAEYTPKGKDCIEKPIHFQVWKFVSFREGYHIVIGFFRRPLKLT